MRRNTRWTAQGGPGRPPFGIWKYYSAYDGSHGLTITGDTPIGGRRYQARILDNPHFCPPETIGKRICWIALQVNEIPARLYRLVYGSLP